MRKRQINIIGGFYRDPNLHWSRQDTLNWIPVRAEQEGTLTPFQLRDAPGVKPFVRITKTVPDGEGTAVIDVGPGRGIRNVEGKLFVVAAQTLYQISNTGVAIPFGTIPGVGRVSMAHNQFGLANQLITVNGSAGYVFNTNTQTLVKITDEGYPGAFIADYIDQYLAQVEPQGRFWFHSDLANGTDYNTLDRYEAEADPDRIVSLIVSHREVLVFGRDTIEPFVNTGGQTGTFERASNTVIEVGCAAKFTPRKLDNSVFWLDDKRLVRRLDGYTPIRVSTDAIDAAFAECTANQIATAYAFTWETRGHKVYYITVPGMFTFGYDVLTGQWHRRATWGMAHWDVIDLAFWNGKWIALSGQNGRLYELDQNYKLDRCDPLVRKRTTGKLWDAENEMTLNNVELKFQTGGPVSTCVLFPDQPEGPSLSGMAPDGLVGQPFSYSYTATPGDSPIARTVLRDGSFVLQDGEPVSFDQSGFSWNESTATISSPSPLEYFIRLVMRTYDQNGLYADHVDEFVIAELNNLLVTSSASPGVPVFASAIASSAPMWTAIPTASGADISPTHPAFWDGRWIAIGEGTLRYATTISGPWSTASTPWPTDSADTVVGGQAGWLVINDEFLNEGIQAKASQVPTDMAVYPMTVDGDPITSLAMIAFSDGIYYADRAGGGGGTLLSSTTLATAWTKLCDSSTSTPGSSGSNAITRFYDIKAFDGALYASVKKGNTGARNQLRRSDDGGQTWPIVLIDNTTDLLAPYQLETGNGVLVVYCWGAQNIYTSANDFSEPIPTGIATNRASAIAEERIARQIAFGGGYFHIISGPFTTTPALGNKYVTTLLGIEVGAPQTIPLSGSLRGIASDRIYDDE